MVLLFSLQPFQELVIPPQLLLPLTSRLILPLSLLQIFQTVTSRLLIRWLNVQILQKKVRIQKNVRIPILVMAFPMNLRSRSRSRAQAKLVITLEFACLFLPW